MPRCKRQPGSLMHWKKEIKSEDCVFLRLMQLFHFTLFRNMIRVLSWTSLRSIPYAAILTMTKSFCGTYWKKCIQISWRWMQLSVRVKEKRKETLTEYFNGPRQQESDLKMTVWTPVGEEYFSVHRASFMGCVCFIVALSEHADGWSGNLLSHDWPPDLCRVFMGHQYGSQVMNYYQTSQSQWLVIHLGTQRKKLKDTSMSLVLCVI